MGFSLQLDQQLKKSADMESLEAWQKCVLLILDEMKIREDLVYDKNSDELIGFTNMGDIITTLLNLRELSMTNLLPHLLTACLYLWFAAYSYP